MKTLICGMQSSGASLYAYYLAQKDDIIGVVDLNNHRLAPFIDSTLDIVLKCVITSRWRIDQHIENFRPDITVFFVRDPFDNYVSLSKKVYSDKSGTIDEKFSILEETFKAREGFDRVVFYEDFVKRYDGYIFRRSKMRIKEFNCANSRWCKDYPEAPGEEGGWGFGNVRGSKISNKTREFPEDEMTRRKVNMLCPSVCSYYGEVLA